MSLNQVFYKNTYFKECNRTSHNQREKAGVNSLKGVLVHNQNSNRQQVKANEKIEDSLEKLLYLEGKPCSTAFIQIGRKSFIAN